MRNHIYLSGRAALALGASVFLTGMIHAQAPGSTNASYPYRASAPSSYHGSTVTVPVPGVSPDAISKSAHSSVDPDHSFYHGGLGSGIGGAYLPPFLTNHDMNVQRPGTRRANSRVSMDNNVGQDDKAHLWLHVPANAQIWVDGTKMKQKGETRYFYSPPLEPGKKYLYEVRVRWEENGKAVEQSQRIVVQAGATIRRDITDADEHQTDLHAKTGETTEGNK